MAMALTRLELDPSALRREARRCRDAKAARRMLALAPREPPPRLPPCGTDDWRCRSWSWKAPRARRRHGTPALGRHTPPAAVQTEHRLRRCWTGRRCGRSRRDRRVHRYNTEGLAGLRDRPHPGPTPRLTPEQHAELARLVEDGPDPALDGVVRWRRVDLQAAIAERFGVQRHERRDRQDPAPARLRPPVGAAQAPVEPARGAGRLQKTSPGWCRRRCPSTRPASRSRSGSPMVERNAFNRAGSRAP